MTNAQSMAFEATLEIVTAAVKENTIPIGDVSGENVGAFFAVIYEKLLSITNSET